MIIQYKTVIKITFLVIILFSQNLKSQQLALPKNNSLFLDANKITSSYLLIIVQDLKSEADPHYFASEDTGFYFSTKVKKSLENIVDNLSYSFGNFCENAIFKSFQGNQFISYSLNDAGRINEIPPFFNANNTSPEIYKAVPSGLLLRYIVYSLTVG